MGPISLPYSRRNAPLMSIRSWHGLFWGGYAGYFQDPRRSYLGGGVESAVDHARLRHTKDWQRRGGKPFQSPVMRNYYVSV